MQNTIINITLSLSLVYIFSCSQTNENKSYTTTSNFNYKLLTIADTVFGYQIYKNTNLYIQQYTIPAVWGKQYFKTKIQAKKVALLVIYKLNTGIVPPTITIKELDSLKIKYIR